MVNKKINLKKEYANSWNYIKSSKKFIGAVVSIFFLFALFGFFIPAPESLSQKIMVFIQELLERTEGMGQGELISFIFFNNLQSSFMGMVFGVFIGIFPAIATISNGYLLGFVSNIAVINGSIFELWRILPHGIFELPAIFISFALGLRLGFSVINSKKYGLLSKNFLLSFKTFILFIIPLLIVAAIIEGTLIFLGK